MQQVNHIAFKEWASIVGAMAAGKQILILRKGGIREENGEFTVEHNEFFLFPTFEHQKKEDLKPEAHHYLDEALQSKPNLSQIPIRFYAETCGIFHLNHEADLNLIDSFHVWSSEAIKERFHFGKNKGLYVLAVKVFQLPKPHQVPYLAEYGGCKSWVELATPLSTEGAKAVLSEFQFSNAWKKVQQTFSLISS